MSDEPGTPNEKPTSHMRRAAIAAAQLAQFKPEVQMRIAGKLASELDETEAARLHTRLTRGRGGKPMSLEQIVKRSGQRARARVTHSRKRSR